MTFKEGSVYKINGIYCMYMQGYSGAHLFIDADKNIIQVVETLPADSDELLKIVENFSEFKRNPDLSRWI